MTQSTVHCETAQLVKQSSKILLLLLPKLKWHSDQQIFTVFANACGVKQSGTFVSLPLLDRRSLAGFAMTKIRESCSCLQQENEDGMKPVSNSARVIGHCQWRFKSHVFFTPLHAAFNFIARGKCCR
ncbi:hypothetical protein [Nitrosomonas sp. H1_AOB3]|uniref:hypothetical protein n=1 Tax=Nitrosomonas sp. H1_AOB3 TaxID=2741553 RepID=UPI0019381DBF|nr:hypothetical protein [Nitrosomonas sp. H1_AOB3]QOJ09275.1 MAG: hypothetical protein HRU73_07285 [Nitrosomonas sp. H1_AOB3]